MLSVACRLLISWQNNCGGRSVHTESNDGVAFAMVSKDKEDSQKSGKKNEINTL